MIVLSLILFTKHYGHSVHHCYCVFHTVNGIRVMLGHGGVGVGTPGRADYPYTPRSQNYRHKIGIYSAIVLAAIAMMYGMAVMFGE